MKPGILSEKLREIGITVVEKGYKKVVGVEELADHDIVIRYKITEENYNTFNVKILVSAKYRDLQEIRIQTTEGKKSMRLIDNIFQSYSISYFKPDPDKPYRSEIEIEIPSKDNKTIKDTLDKITRIRETIKYVLDTFNNTKKKYSFNLDKKDHVLCITLENVCPRAVSGKKRGTVHVKFTGETILINGEDFTKSYDLENIPPPLRNKILENILDKILLIAGLSSNQELVSFEIEGVPPFVVTHIKTKIDSILKDEFFIFLLKSIKETGKDDFIDDVLAKEILDHIVREPSTIMDLEKLGLIDTTLDLAVKHIHPRVSTILGFKKWCRNPEARLKGGIVNYRNYEIGIIGRDGDDIIFVIESGSPEWIWIPVKARSIEEAVNVYERMGKKRVKEWVERLRAIGKVSIIEVIEGWSIPFTVDSKTQVFIVNRRGTPIGSRRRTTKRRVNII